ncbi:MAG: hypothetical protein ABSC62_05385 [Terracidiphilus sp.]
MPLRTFLAILAGVSTVVIGYLLVIYGLQWAVNHHSRFWLGSHQVLSVEEVRYILVLPVMFAGVFVALIAKGQERRAGTLCAIGVFTLILLLNLLAPDLLLLRSLVPSFHEGWFRLTYWVGGFCCATWFGAYLVFDDRQRKSRKNTPAESSVGAAIELGSEIAEITSEIFKHH